MTDDQIKIALALDRVTFLPGTWTKRFARSMTAIAEAKPDTEITEAQNEWLYRLLYKYRRQIPNTYAGYQTNLLCGPKN